MLGHDTYWLRDSLPFAGRSYKQLMSELSQLGCVDDTAVQADYANRKFHF